jgi:hypothetical protein
MSSCDISRLFAATKDSMTRRVSYLTTGGMSLRNQSHLALKRGAEPRTPGLNLKTQRDLMAVRPGGI